MVNLPFATTVVHIFCLEISQSMQNEKSSSVKRKNHIFNLMLRGFLYYVQDARTNRNLSAIF
jgi:hypothetical protein